MKLNYKAIGIGGLVDLGGTALFGTIAISLIAIIVNSPDTQPYQLYDKVFNTTFFITLTIVIAAIFNFLGGYVAARSAQNAYVTYGALSSIPCIIVGIFTVINPLGSPTPEWLIYSGKIMAIFFGALGGYFCKRHITNH